MTAADLTALWDATKLTLESDVERELLRLAREGHHNRDAIVKSLLPGPCPACDGDVCDFEKDWTRERREAVGALIAGLKEGGTT